MRTRTQRCQITYTYRLLNLDGIDVYLVPGVGELGVEMEDVAIVDLLAHGHLAQHPLLPQCKALECPPQLSIIYVISECSVSELWHATGAAGGEARLNAYPCLFAP